MTTDLKVKKCPFKVGDLVQHRASGELGVVEDIGYECKMHGSTQHALNNLGLFSGSPRALDPCDKEYTGVVSVSIGYQKTVALEDYLLTKKLKLRKK